VQQPEDLPKKKDEDQLRKPHVIECMLRECMHAEAVHAKEMHAATVHAKGMHAKEVHAERNCMLCPPCRHPPLRSYDAEEAAPEVT
jgi:hypothetical protein